MVRITSLNFVGERLVPAISGLVLAMSLNVRTGVTLPMRKPMIGTNPADEDGGSYRNLSGSFDGLFVAIVLSAAINLRTSKVLL